MQVNYDLTVLNPEIMLIGSHEKNCMSKSRPAPFYFFFQIKPFKNRCYIVPLLPIHLLSKMVLKQFMIFSHSRKKKKVSDSDLMDLLEVK